METGARLECLTGELVLDAVFATRLRNLKNDFYLGIPLINVLDPSVAVIFGVVAFSAKFKVSVDPAFRLG